LSSLLPGKPLIKTRDKAQEQFLSPISPIGRDDDKFLADVQLKHFEGIRKV
jgi:hypothetical protein